MNNKTERSQPSTIVAPSFSKESKDPSWCRADEDLDVEVLALQDLKSNGLAKKAVEPTGKRFLRTKDMVERKEKKKKKKGQQSNEGGRLKWRLTVRTEQH